MCLRALGNERRLKIVTALHRSPMAVVDIADLLRCSEAAASKHLHRLLACGMVDREQRGYHAVYSLIRSERFIRMVLPLLRS